MARRIARGSAGRSGHNRPMPKDDPGSDLRATAPYRPALAERPEALGDKRLEEAMQSVLAMAHSHNAKASIKGPNERGGIPSLPWTSLGPGHRKSPASRPRREPIARRRDP